MFQRLFVLPLFACVAVGCVGDKDTPTETTDPTADADTDADADADADSDADTDSTAELDVDGDGLTGSQEASLGTDPMDDDSDDDGLLDGAEVNTHGTDPLRADSDDDGLLDGDEVALGTDPLEQDTDLDGLVDGDEVDVHGTDPVLIDTDGGGADDGAEVVEGTDPLDAADDAYALDADGDGLSDGDEADLGTDPASADSDNDLLIDGVEVDVHGTDPLRADTDGDTLLDGQEVFSVGSDPTLFDTDGGGADDGLEWGAGSDVSDPEDDRTVLDRDGDGLTDADEEDLYGTDPLLADTDGDGLRDDVELNVYGTDPLLFDTDGGGLPDGYEIGAGLDPSDALDDEPADLLLFDEGFETGALDAAIWASQSQVLYDATTVRTGTYALNVPAFGLAESVTFDTTPCTRIAWSMDVKRGPVLPAVGADLLLEYSDGTSWWLLHRVPGGTEDVAFERIVGTLTDARAMHGTFAVRLRNQGADLDNDDYYVDGLSVACEPDLQDDDGDGVANHFDCDPEPEHYFDCGQCVDGDGDGYGALCDLGPDCDDADALRSPGVVDKLGDGDDLDCSGLDGPGQATGFEGAALEPPLRKISGNAAFDDTTVRTGAVSLALGGGAVVDGLPLDGSLCATGVEVLYYAKRGPEAPPSDAFLVFEVFNGEDWIEVERHSGDGTTDADFGLVVHVLDEPWVAAGPVPWRLREQGGSRGGARFYVDDLMVQCAPTDADGDGFTVSVDCDDADAAHWFDCGLCIDADGDDHGVDCDLGEDCDDADAARFYGNADPYGDGVDGDCSGLDGPSFDDAFESGALDVDLWPTVVGNVGVTTLYAADGSYSLGIDGGGEVTTAVVDTTVCTEVLWFFEGKRGASAPEVGDDLEVQYFDGVDWVVADTWEGTGATDAVFVPRWGTITDPGALGPHFQLRLVHTQLTAGDDFYVDGLVISCTEPDTDSDGVVEFLDCDEGDPAHWFDCGVCADGDGDGYGQDCDWGADCSDADVTVHPGASDAVGDLLDDDCSGIDGPGVFDDLDAGSAGAGIPSLVGDTQLSSTYASSPWSLYLGGGGGEARLSALPLDGCPQLAWELAVLRGSVNAPEATDTLALQVHDPRGWHVVWSLAGTGSQESAFTRYTGVSDDPDLLRTALNLRLQSTGNGAGFDDFLVDDLAVGCDDDEDGLATPAELALYGSDPDLADTDADGVDDGDEVSAGTDPLDATSF
ncbi:MAG: thrombospondin type 3 repeat-containing protein [Myxococcales bacterium]|nr:thrombospondin type 3 repeat-containing protein [Myxococcales bacterium]